MPEASSSFFTFLTSYKNKPEISCRKDILSWVNWWQLTVPSLTLFFPWPGPITEVEARRQKRTSVLTSIVGIPRKIFPTDGKGPERPFVSQILEPGETGILDRGYQSHKNFDLLQQEGKHFVCRIKANTLHTCLESYPVSADSIVFHDAGVLLGKQEMNQTEKFLRLVGYQIEDKQYRIAADRFDPTAEQIALVYKLRWDIEKFFAWWKQHLKVWLLIARSRHGLMIQILAGLITYLLLAIYCHEQHGEPVSINRVRQLRNQILNESRTAQFQTPEHKQQRNNSTENPHANS